MLFFAFSIFSFSLKPIILLPGLYGSNLKATYNNWSSHWYCNSKLDEGLFWVDITYAIPPRYNCLFEMLRADYDATLQKIVPQKDLKVSVHDFKGIEGISYADHGIPFDFHVFESFGPMVSFLLDHGYRVKQDLFGAPYNWVMAMDGLDDFYPQLKDLVEEAYSKNDNQKVTILGFSLGGFVLQQFLLKYSEDWKSKYISKLVLLAPAFAGAGQTLDVAWHQTLPILPFLKSDIITESVMRVPVLSALFPNHVVFDNITIVVTKEKNYTASSVVDFLATYDKVTGKWVDLMKANARFSSKRLAEPNVPVYMIYNSRLETLLGLDFSKGIDQEPDHINAGGDGTVPQNGPEWVCENWKQKSELPVVCFDTANDDSEEFDHSGMSYNPYVHELIFNAANDIDNWTQEKGNKFIQGPHVSIFRSIPGNHSSFAEFQIREDIRPQTERKLS